MKTDETTVFAKSEETKKRRKGYFERLLELQIRKTDSDRRREFFGIDPLVSKN